MKTDGGCAALQRISLSAQMIDDHLTASYYEALGQENLTQKTFVEEGKVEPPEEAGGKPGEGSAGEQGGGDGEHAGEQHPAAGERKADAGEDAAEKEDEDQDESGAQGTDASKEG